MSFSMSIQLRLIKEPDLPQLLPLVRAYHEFEGIAHPDADTESALRPLIGESALGRIWLVCLASQPIGYVALCFGYSIEFAGRDAFVDEMFIAPKYRGRGFGQEALALVRHEAAELGIRALHLEVARDNRRAQSLYRRAGFAPRDRFLLMSARLERRDADVAVRPVAAGDAGAWLKMRCALWPEGPEAEHRDEIGQFFAGRIGEPLAVLLAVDRGGRAVGFAELSIRPCAEGCRSSRIAFLEGWYVVPERRGRGAGRALVAAAEDWGRAQGCSEFASDVQPDNLISRRAHRALGFEEVGVIHCFRKPL